MEFTLGQVGHLLSALTNPPMWPMLLLFHNLEPNTREIFRSCNGTDTTKTYGLRVFHQVSVRGTQTRPNTRYKARRVQMGGK